jgi:hypothetical protein
MWTPLPHEEDLFCNVYIDESSQTDHRYFVLGGLVVPLSHAAQFETDIIAVAKPDGTPRVIKWQKVNPYNVASYGKVIDAFFAFEAKRRLPLTKNVDINCRVVDTHETNLRDLALQLRFPCGSESMGDHDSEVMDGGSID